MRMHLILLSVLYFLSLNVSANIDFEILYNKIRGKNIKATSEKV